MRSASPISEQPLILPYGYSRWAALVSLLAFGGFSYWFWREGISGVSALVWFGFSAFAIIAGFLFGESRVFFREKKLIRVWRLFGLVTVRRREYPLTAFRGVQRRHLRGPDHSTWMVGLVEPSGKFLAFQWFSSGSVEGPCAEASSYALRLAEITGLPLIETQVA